MKRRRRKLRDDLGRIPPHEQIVESFPASAALFVEAIDTGSGRLMTANGVTSIVFVRFTGQRGGEPCQALVALQADTDELERFGAALLECAEAADDTIFPPETRP